jgi:hypothetical protein
MPDIVAGAASAALGEGEGELQHLVALEAVLSDVITIESDRRTVEESALFSLPTPAYRSVKPAESPRIPILCP